MRERGTRARSAGDNIEISGAEGRVLEPQARPVTERARTGTLPRMSLLLVPPSTGRVALCKNGFVQPQTCFSQPRVSGTASDQPVWAVSTT